MPPIDPHSFTESTQPLTTHVSLSFFFDFPSSTISASALLSLSSAFSGDLLLDTRSLSVTAVLDPATRSRLPFVLSPEPDPVKGACLTVSLSGHSRLLVVFTTSPGSSALQWLTPPQTFNKTLPFVYTQCQAIHARSIFPCQDTPAARIRYSARLNVPRQLSAVMSAKHVERRSPVAGEAEMACDDSLWCAEDRVVEEFVMEQPIPPYLFAFAVGEIGYREVGPRTRVYSESVPSLLDAAAKEFATTEDVIRQGEKLFGPYVWERFDLLVLPPSFPYGGMENPRMVFLTPTVIKGDASGAQVVAHELAHSWTGNLITNKTNDHFWLNEGFTTYAERRIVEVVQGEDRAALNIGIGWKGLNEEMERFKDNMEFTKLKTNQEGVDPDDVYSQVPYEKGFQFLCRIERQIGRPAFDEFLKKYISTFKFQSIDTDTFLDFLKSNVPGIEKEVDLIEWTEGTGIPEDAMAPVSNIYTKIISLANEFKNGMLPKEDEVADWGGQEWELYLENLPRAIEASQIGRPAFDEFLKKYISTFKFQSIDTDTFLDFLKSNVPGIEKEVDLIEWTEGTGIPEDAMAPVSNIYTKIISLANEFKNGMLPKEDEVADWGGQEWELYLENLPRAIEASQITALDERYKLAESKNYEVKVAFLQLAIAAKCRDYYPEVEKTLKDVGRMLYLRPLYTALAQGKEEEKVLAKRVFAEARDTYHPIAQGVVESILSKHL